jgi:hypothetical protein
MEAVEAVGGEVVAVFVAPVMEINLFDHSLMSPPLLHYFHCPREFYQTTHHHHHYY